MACVSGTNIVNDGLVFHFDLENGVKSWKGKPTSNLAPFTDYRNRNYNQQIDIGGWGGDDGYAVYYQNGGWNNLPYKKITKTANGTGGSYINEHSYFTLEEGKTYTISCYMRSDRPQTHNGHLLALNRNSDNAYFVPSNIILSTEWERKTWTHTVASGGGSNTYHFRQIVYTDTPTDVYWSALQVEEGSLATKYVNGIRLHTASILDVSPTQSTITASNLTYRQDDTPTFDGTNDYLSSPSLGTLDAMTIDTWVYSNENKYASIAGDFSTITDSVGLRLNWRLQGAVWAEFGEAGIGNSVQANVNTNQWYNIVGMATNNDAVKLYINGTHIGTTPTTKVFTAGLPLYIGKGDFGEYFHGEISQVKIYNKALTDAEVRQNFEATRTRYGI